jgi:hypothetical protein
MERAIMDPSFFLMNLWRWSAGLPELEELPVHRFTVEQADEETWSPFPDLIEMMRRRILMGIYRHGSYQDPNQPKYDRVSSALARLKLYQEMGNGEYLLDAANLCLIEFVKRTHPKFHFTATDDGVHAEIVQP